MNFTQNDTNSAIAEEQSLRGTKQLKYSVCVTNYNSIDTIRESMASILDQLKGDFEIVVCDNCSNDGSLEILQEYARKGQIKLIVERSSRGKGRQTAFENSTGQNIISGVDTDDRLKPAIREFIEIYQREHKGYMLSSNTIHIIPRALVKRIGGWNDLQFFEDVDFVQRAESIGSRHELKHRLVLVERGNNKRHFVDRIKERYDAAQCAYRIGKNVFDEVKTSEWFSKPTILFVALYATVVCKLKRIQRLKHSET